MQRSQLYKLALPFSLILGAIFIDFFLWAKVPGVSYVIFYTLATAFLLYPILRVKNDKNQRVFLRDPRVWIASIILFLVPFAFMYRLKLSTMAYMFVFYPLIHLGFLMWLLRLGGQWYLSLRTVLVLPLLITIAWFGDAAKYLADLFGNLKTRTSYLAHIKWIIIGVLASLPLFIIVIMLLADADPVFEDWMLNIWNHTLGAIFTDFEAFFEFVMKLAVGFVVSVYYAGVMYMLWLKDSTAQRLASSWLVGRSVIKRDGFVNITFASTVLTMINFVLVIFVASQFYVLFGDKDEIFGKYEFTTYAQYAREGFWQLFFGALIVLGLVTFLRTFTKALEKGKVAKSIFHINVYIMALTTAIVGWSAIRRMWMYIDAFGITNRRIIALYMIAVIAVTAVFLAIISKMGVFRKYFSRYIGWMIIVTVLLTWLVPTDYIVSRWNVDRYLRDGENFDIAYALTLSPEADGPLMDIIRDGDDDVVRAILYEHVAAHYEICDDDMDRERCDQEKANRTSWRSFNFMRKHNEQKLKELEKDISADRLNQKVEESIRDFLREYEEDLRAGEYELAFENYWRDDIKPFDYQDLRNRIVIHTYRPISKKYQYGNTYLQPSWEDMDIEYSLSAMTPKYGEFTDYVNEGMPINMRLVYDLDAHGSDYCENSIIYIVLVDGEWKIVGDTDLPLGNTYDRYYSDYNWTNILDYPNLCP